MSKQKQREIVEIYDPKELEKMLRKCIKKEYLKKYEKLYGKEKLKDFMVNSRRIL